MPKICLQNLDLVLKTRGSHIFTILLEPLAIRWRNMWITTPFLGLFYSTSFICLQQQGGLTPAHPVPQECMLCFPPCAVLLMLWHKSCQSEKHKNVYVFLPHKTMFVDRFRRKVLSKCKERWDPLLHVYKQMHQNLPEAAGNTLVFSFKNCTVSQR